MFMSSRITLVDVRIDSFSLSSWTAILYRINNSGSTVVYPYNSTSLRWAELGASIFVEVNRNMMRAAKEFNLNLTRFDSEADNEMGIWDGKQFVIQVRYITVPGLALIVDIELDHLIPWFIDSRSTAADGRPGLTI